MPEPINLRGIERTAKNVRERVDAGVPAAMHVTTGTMLALVAAVRAARAFRACYVADSFDTLPEIHMESLRETTRDLHAALARFTDEEPDHE